MPTFLSICLTKDLSGPPSRDPSGTVVIWQGSSWRMLMLWHQLNVTVVMLWPVASLFLRRNLVNHKAQSDLWPSAYTWRASWCSPLELKGRGTFSKMDLFINRGLISGKAVFKCCCCWNKVPCSLGWSWSQYVVKDDVKNLTLLLLLPKCWDYGHHYYSGFT